MDNRQSFISYVYKNEMIPNEIFNAALTQMFPRPGIVICSMQNGVFFSYSANSFETLPETEIPKHHLEFYRNMFMNQTNSASEPIEQIFIPVYLRFQMHWGYLVCKRIFSECKEKREIGRDHGLNFTCPRSFVSCFVKCLNFCFGKDCISSIIKRNYSTL